MVDSKELTRSLYHLPMVLRSSLVLALVFFVGCGAEAKDDSVIVLCASSTREACESVLSSTPHVQLSSGASNAHAMKIRAGARASLFLSASSAWGDRLESEGLVIERRDLLSNRLVLCLPAASGQPIASIDDFMARPEARLALAGESVPMGVYARQVLRNLGLLDALGAQGRIVGGQDARSTLSFVERGEVAAGIVYATDLRMSKRVRGVQTFDSDLHDPI
ncbi:MAG: molybdate ABC transporter substrate-binding protein, partial [Planctomycetes bacterium]|nr:molybdate ABC transporter substrate-binding protein [Planctomycetota bacterium]